MPGQIPPASHRKPKVFIDADVLFAGSVAPTEHGASLVVLRMAEITLLEAYTSHQAVAEVERNLEIKLPKALPVFRLLLSRCLQIVPDPDQAELLPFDGLANAADLPILVAAVKTGCSWLVSFNTRHFHPGYPDVVVLPPGDFLIRVRDLLSRL